MAAIGRFQKGDDVFYARVVDGEIFRLHGDVFGSPSFDKKPTSIKGVRTLIPVVPSKIVAVGLNYADHARESGKPLPKEPLFWIKATTSLIADGGKIEVPFPNHRTDFEAELAIVIGRRVRNVTPAGAARYIFGYTASQDISDRTIQNAREPMDPRQIFRHVHSPRSVRGDKDRSSRPDHTTVSERAAQAELEHQSAAVQLLSPGQLHLHQHDPFAG